MTTDWLYSLLEPLQLELPSGDQLPDIPLNSDLRLIGSLNPLAPTIIQIIGQKQLAQLVSLSPPTHLELMNHIAKTGTRLLIVSDDMEIISNTANIPVARTPFTCEQILALTMASNNLESPEICRHGVFMDVLGSGVLLTGSANIGKSELALELITRGHSLIADDAPCFSLISGNNIQGVSPDILREFLEVRGLGVVNVRAMFGDNAVIHHKNLDLIIHLCHFEPNEEIAVDRLYGTVHQQEILGKAIDTIEIPVAEGRNLAVLVETAVRNYNLRLKGYNSANAFIKRQQSFMDIDAE